MEIIVIGILFALLTGLIVKYVGNEDKLLQNHKQTLMDWNDYLVRQNNPNTIVQPEPGSPIFVDIPEMPDELKRYYGDRDEIIDVEADVLGQ